MMTYDIKQRHSVLTHFPSRLSYVADIPDDLDGADLSNLLIEARLRSGDYFVTLATELEKLAEVLESDGIPESTALIQLSKELTYLDKHYRLAAK